MCGDETSFDAANLVCVEGKSGSAIAVGCSSSKRNADADADELTEVLVAD